MSTRRTFLKSSAALAATLPFARLPLTAVENPGAASPSALTQKEGLLFAASDLPRIRANLDLPRCTGIRDMLLNVDFDAETKFLRDEIKMDNHVVDFARARRLVENCSFAHAVWGDQRQHLCGSCGARQAGIRAAGGTAERA
jgi:hypothetical protein